MNYPTEYTQKIYKYPISDYLRLVMISMVIILTAVCVKICSMTTNSSCAILETDIRQFSYMVFGIERRTNTDRRAKASALYSGTERRAAQRSGDRRRSKRA